MAVLTIRSYRNAIDAELAKAQLEASGIPAVVVGQHFASVYAGALGEAEVQVACSGHDGPGTWFEQADRGLEEHDPETARLEEEISACRAALDVRTREQVPLDAICEALDVHLGLWQFARSEAPQWHASARTTLLRDLAGLRGACPAAQQARDALSQQQESVAIEGDSG